jgi:predicted GNAT family acetyltransferase
MLGHVPTVRDNPEQERYEVLADDGNVAGYVAYHRRADLIAFVHTEIDPAYEGQGLGSVLVKTVLDEAREQGMAVLPFCPFVRGYIERHEEYVDLEPPEYRETFELRPAAG